MDDYQLFVDKFKPKKTTDDCYTPPNVYDVVKNWALKEYGWEGRTIVRPFYPGGVVYKRDDRAHGIDYIDNICCCRYSHRRACRRCVCCHV